MRRTAPTARSGKTLKRSFPWEYLLLPAALAAAMLSLLEFMECQKWLVLLCCLASALLAAIALFGKKERETLPLFSLLYGVYLLWLALGILWVCSGKLYFREFSKQLFALPLTLYLLFLMPRKEASLRKPLFLLSAVGAFYAILSIDNASLGLSHKLLYLLPGFENGITGFEKGTRLTGIFGNGNISAGLLAICIFLSLYLLESSENKRERMFAAVFAALQAETFLLNFSLGATGFFLLSAIVYLLFAGEKRGSVLLRMLEIAVPVVISVFFSFRFFNSSSQAALPLLAAALCAAVTAALELTVYPRLVKTVEKRQRLSSILLCAVALLLCVYGAFGVLLRGSAKVEAGQSLPRACYLAPGAYTLSVQSEGVAKVKIESQDTREVVMHTQTRLYSGNADGAEFVVPEGSRVVYLTFTAPKGAVVTEAVLNGPESVSLHLGYPLLPGFIANRLQGLSANENVIQRAAFFRDGMKVFRDHPLLGTGLGGFETMLFGYQEFYYETKYVHNHYIQTLLDGGVIGFLLYLSLLAATAAALWRGRRKDAPFRALHPALCAAFVMIVLHSVMEVVMSATVYLPYALAVFSLAAVCFGPEVGKDAVRRVSSALPGAAALIYAILIVLNMSADATVRKSTSNVTRFFGALESAAKMDAFEKNDWMVSYISTCADYQMTAYRKQSNLYAEKLMDVPSNSLHRYLIRYYLVFQEYEQALRAAKMSAQFNYSDKSNWNSSFNGFSSALTLHPEDSAQILDCVRALERELQEYQERLMEPIQLDSVSEEIIAAATKDM